MSLRPVKSMANSNPLVAKGDVQFLFFSHRSSDCAILDEDSLEILDRKKSFIQLKPLSLSMNSIDLFGVHSCNGLLFLPVKGKNTSLRYLYNPVIGEFARVPDPKIIDPFYLGFYDLGYCPDSKKFKLMRFIRTRFDDDTPELQILTLGSPDGWRTYKGEVPKQIWNKSETATFLDGVLHWLLLQKRLILTFDLEGEVFSIVPLPPLDADTEIYKLGVMDNSLVVTAGLNLPLGLEIWARRHCVQGFVWTKDWVIDLHVDRTITTSTLKCLIPWKVSDDGKIFMLYLNQLLFCYEPDKRIVYQFSLSPKAMYENVIAHTASLLSPKALLSPGGPKDEGKMKVAGTC